MAIEVVSLPLPASAEPSKFKDFGREVKGVNPGTLTPEEFKEIERLLYEVRPSHLAPIAVLIIPLALRI